jgi:hypothetical protein
MHNQPTVDCASAPEMATAGDLGGIPGVADSDVIEFDFIATVALKPSGRSGRSSGGSAVSGAFVGASGRRLRLGLGGCAGAGRA